MGKLGRAIGFLAGGAASGYGQGIVEEAKMNWSKMLQDQSDAKADARESRRMEFEKGQKALDREQRSGEFAQESALKEKEITTRADETRANREETRAYREQQAADTKAYRESTIAEQRRYRQDQYNLRLREIEGKEAKLNDVDMKDIEGAEKSLFGDNQFVDEEERAKKAPQIVAALREAGKEKAARYYATLHGVAEEASPAPPTAAPGLGGGKASPSSSPSPAADANADALDRAREAIRRGANPELVKERLRSAGIDPSGL